LLLKHVPIELNRTTPLVIAGLNPAIHVALSIGPVSMDAWVKPAHDNGKNVSTWPEFVPVRRF
jgi:hypothetical protein